MILRHLQLTNFRKYRSARIEFPAGLVGIVGPNGAGKSTLFEAFAWVLFGNGMSRTGGFGLATTGSRPREPCEVEAEFEHAGEVYRIVRRLTGRGISSWAKVHRGKTLAATGPIATSRFVRQLLGADARTFLRIVYCRQGEVRGLSGDFPTRRREVIAEVADLGLLDRVLRQVREDSARFPPGPTESKNIPDDLEERLCEARLRIRSLRREEAEERGRVESKEPTLRKLQEILAEVALLSRHRAALQPILDRGEEDFGESLEGVMRRWLENRGRASALSARVAELRRMKVGVRGTSCPLCGGPIQREELLGRLSREGDECGEELRRLAREERELSELRKGAERMRDRRKAQREWDGLESRRLTLEKRAAEMKGVEGEIRLARDRCQDVQRQIQEWVGKESAMRTALDWARKRSANRRGKLLHRLAELLEEFRDALLERARIALGDPASDLLELATQGRYTDLQLDRDFRARMADGGRPFVLERFSGGERDVAGVALRVGLSRLLSFRHPAEFLILDEVLAGQDRSRRRILLAALFRLCPPLKQIFLITHMEEIEDSIPAVIRIGEDENGFAQVLAPSGCDR